MNQFYEKKIVEADESILATPPPRLFIAVVYR